MNILHVSVHDSLNRVDFVELVCALRQAENLAGGSLTIKFYPPDAALIDSNCDFEVTIAGAD